MIISYCHVKTGLVCDLHTAAAKERFFDNRNPDDWVPVDVEATRGQRQ